MFPGKMKKIGNGAFFAIQKKRKCKNRYKMTKNIPQAKKIETEPSIHGFPSALDVTQKW